MTNDSETLAQLKTAILKAQTVGDIYAVIEDYTYQEFEQVYQKLTPNQQTRLEAIRDRDTHLQLIAIHQPLNLTIA
ncbi:MAG: hypothetical protein RID09_07275 [Coleofasciculus sp. G1-WW12-02]|uniref:hypothetical protein n=1 Tax=Coleofasciculus sp. G1-WW12-02 TaxID=3068483 RepID=UPI0032FDD6E7